MCSANKMAKVKICIVVLVLYFVQVDIYVSTIVSRDVQRDKLLLAISLVPDSCTLAFSTGFNNETLGGKEFIRNKIHLSRPHVLTMCGYLENEPWLLKDRYDARHFKCVFQKSKLKWTLILVTLLQPSLYVEISTFVSKSVVYYLLLMSGIETNPGPRNETPERKRLRKAGVRYKTYLSSRNSFDTAPMSLQQAVNTGESKQSTSTEELNIHTVLADENEISGANSISITREVCSTSMEICSDYHDTEGSGNSDNDDYESSGSEFINLSDCPSSDSDSDTQEESEFDIDTKLIYEGAQITLGTSLFLIMTFVLNHNLTGEAFSDLLELVQLHCKENNLLPDKTVQMKKLFRNLKTDPKKHYYCGDCLLKVDLNSLQCPNQKCRKSFRIVTDKCFFIEVPLTQQLRKLFVEEDFSKKLVNFENCQMRDINNTIEEMYDGLYYKNLRASGSLSPSDITLTWNTDGVPLFKSSKTSMWPLFFTINELPYAIRRKRENLLLAGLWIGSKKPEMMTFLDPFIEDLKTLENGIDIRISTNTDKASTYKLRGYVIAGTADLPAKCMVHNMMQFNGKYSCPYCIQPGETTKAGRGFAHIFPFQYDGAIDPKRTHHGTLENAKKAFETSKPELGIKGPCWFSKSKFYDFVKSNCIDYMHCVLLGVTKRLISLWFSKENSNESFSVFTKTEETNRRLARLKPPLFITRAPRPLHDLKYWKASEFKSFLLYYGPVILADILENSYYSNFLLLSEGIYILLKDSISMEELQHAENLLEQFVMTFGSLYNPRYLTLNFHLLLHLPENVRQLGPLWGYSCFPYEDGNGFLMKLIKGTQSVHSQLIDSISIVHGLPYLRKSSVDKGSRAENLLNSITRYIFKKCTPLKDEVMALGKISRITTDDLSRDCYVAIANQLHELPDGRILRFKRIKLSDGVVLHSREYTRVKVRNSYTISYMLNDIPECGIIHYFAHYIKQNSASFTKTFAIVTPLEDTSRSLPLFPRNDVTDYQQMKHMKVYKVPDVQNVAKIAVPIEKIIYLCVYMASPMGDAVVCCPPNRVEKE